MSWDGTFYKRLQPKIYEKIAKKLEDAKLILDLGCGDGQLTNFLALRLKKKIFCVDISDAGFDRAKTEAKVKNVSALVEYIKSDASELSNIFEKEAFSGVVCVITLHEFKQPLVILKEVKKILERVGKLLIIDFVKGGYAERIWGERYYTPTEIRSMLKRSGFEKMDVCFPYDDLIFVQAL